MGTRIRRASRTTALEAVIKEGDSDTLDMLLELLLEQKVTNLHAAELGETEFSQKDVELETS